MKYPISLQAVSNKQAHREHLKAYETDRAIGTW